MELLKEVISENRPNRVPGLQSMIETIKSLVGPAEVMVGGSLARNTHLPSYDCDIFIIYPKGSINISERLAMHIASLHPERVHGSRDYFHLHRDGVLFELIPVLETTDPEEAENVTDVSPLHIVWVRENIRGLEDDVRLLKLFLHSLRIYGAESYINGFSGYVTEILIIHYGGFLPLLKGASRWSGQVIVDVQKHFTSKQELHFTLNKAKQIGPLIAIDPVQPSRNAAAALAQPQFDIFVGAAQSFLASPSKNAFTPRPLSLDNLEHKADLANGVLSILRATPLQGKRDVVGAKLLQTWQYIIRITQSYDFAVEGTDWFWDDDVMMYFILTPKQLGPTQKVMGPSKDQQKKHIEAFQKKHKTFKLDGDRYFAIIPREVREPSEALDLAINDSYVTGRVSKIWLQKKISNKSKRS